MSFSVLYAERARDVKRVLSKPGDNDPFRYGEKLGELTREYLAAVAELVPDEMGLIVKANGHSDPHWTSVTIELGCAQPVPAPPAETPQADQVQHENVHAADTAG